MLIETTEDFKRVKNVILKGVFKQLPLMQVQILKFQHTRMKCFFLKLNLIALKKLFLI